ncbi:hypothetical protein FRC10_012106 [Ceratobasidium sp. 414]|nr:hypothetical protein FRC10_012106 [Ceratobasidium sp. 414]
MAGTGKTTIAYSLCKQLESSGKLAASFFCSRALPTCWDATRILPSISHQLALKSRPFQSALSTMLDQNPNAHELPLSEQLEMLIVAPLRNVKHTFPFPSDMVIVIDGLDECENTDGINQILDALLALSSNLPVKFFVASRPSQTTVVGSEHRTRLVWELRLDEIERSTVQKDIRTYMMAEQEHINLSSSNIDSLVQQSGALFLYADMLAGYVRHGSLPGGTERLKQLLDTLTPSEIDLWYTTILHGILDDSALESRRKDRIMLVLRAVVYADEPLTVDQIADLLGVDPIELSQHTLPSLWSLLQVSGTSIVTTLHSSLSNYMLDRRRSTRVNDYIRQCYAQLMLSCFDLIRQPSPPFNICHLESSYLWDREVPDMGERVNKAISKELLHACRQWATYLELARDTEEVMNALRDFLTTRLLVWMEILNLTHYMRDGVEQLRRLNAWLKGVECSDSLRLLTQDARSFMTAFLWSPLSDSTPHIYVSMLALWEKGRPIATHYIPMMSGFVNATGSGRKWGHPVDVNVLPCKTGQCCATFSQDGAYIAYYSDDNTIRTWNVHAGKLVGQKVGYLTYSVCSIAYSPDGAHIVSGSSDSAICIWDTRTGELVGQPLQGHTDWVYSIVYSPDGAYIVSGSDDKTIRIWDARTQQPVGQPLVGHAGSVNSVAYSPDGAFIASGSSDKTIRVWNAHTQQPVGQPLEGHTGAVRSLAYSPNGAHIVSGSRDWTVRIWDAYTGQPVSQPLEGHGEAVTSVTYSPDGAYIASGSEDKTICIWDAHTWQLVVQPLEGHTAPIRSIAYSSDGAYVMTSSDDNTVRTWDACMGRPVGQPLQGHKNLVHSVAYSPDGSHFVSGSDDWTTRIWHASTGELVGQPLGGHTGAVLSVAYSRDGAYIISGSSDMTIRIWSTCTHQPVGQPIKGHTGWVLSVAYSPDGAYIVSGSHDNTIRIWDARTRGLVGRPLEGHTGSVRSVAYSSDGAYIASGSNDCTIRIWDALTGQPLGQPLAGHTGRIWSVAYSPDGAYIASASIDDTIRIWDAHTQELVGQPLKGHTDSVQSVAYSPDGAYIISGSNDNTIRIWDAHTGELIGKPLEGHTDLVLSVAHSPDGGYILSGSQDHVIRTYVAHPTHVTLAQTAISQPGPSGSHPPDSTISSGAEHDTLANPTMPTDDTTGRASHPEATKTADDWTMDRDGWVLSPNRERLLWVPYHLQRGLVRPRSKIVISRGGTLSLDFKDAKLGGDWQSCFDPSRVS